MERWQILEVRQFVEIVIWLLQYEQLEMPKEQSHYQLSDEKKPSIDLMIVCGWFESCMNVSIYPR